MSGKRRSYFHNFYSNPGTAEDMPTMRGLRFGQSVRPMRDSPAFSAYELCAHSGICFAGWKSDAIRRKSCSPCADCVSGKARAQCAIHPHFQNMNFAQLRNLLCGLKIRSRPAKIMLTMRGLHVGQSARPMRDSPAFSEYELCAAQVFVLRAENPKPSGENHTHHARIAFRAKRAPNVRFTRIFRI